MPDLLYDRLREAASFPDPLETMVVVRTLHISDAFSLPAKRATLIFKIFSFLNFALFYAENTLLSKVENL